METLTKHLECLPFYIYYEICNSMTAETTVAGARGSFKSSKYIFVEKNVITVHWMFVYNTHKTFSSN